MLGTSILNKQLERADTSDCDTNANGYSSKLIGNSSNVKENQNIVPYLHCYNGTSSGCCAPKRKQSIDSEFSDLLLTPAKVAVANDNSNHVNRPPAKEEPLASNSSDEPVEQFSEIFNGHQHNHHSRLTPFMFDHDSIATINRYQQQSWDQNYSFPRLIHPTHSEPYVLQPSLFHKNNVPPTIYFNTKLNEDSKPPIGLPKRLQPLFKWKISSITPNTIRNCISFMKFETIRPNVEDKYYLGSWCKHMPTADFTGLEEWRKVNHYPGSFHMGRKDKLWLRLKLASGKFDSFHPTTFILPKDYEEFERYWRSSPNKLFIIKPPASARGNGIKVINDISQIPKSALQSSNDSGSNGNKKSSMIVQQYISNPCLLENGYKFDLRVYVLLASVDPLRVYVYEEGLVRFASSKYTSQEDGIIDQYMHLTNYFVNKTNHKYKINNDSESLHGCKWSLKRFWRYLNENHSHVDTKKLWDEIIDIIIKTIISCEGPMNRLSNQFCKNDYTSYELFGFDIILDESFKPWILEVNITPSLKSESNLDSSVKCRVIKDMFNLVGYHLPPPCIDLVPILGGLCQQKLFFNPLLYHANLSKRDRIKHLKYQKLFKLEMTNDETTESAKAPEANLESQRRLPIEGSALPKAVTSSPSSQQAELKSATNSSDQNHNDQSQSSDEDSSASRCGRERLISKESILSDLSQSDIRVLMIAEDELSRSGQFRRVFPSADSSKYLKYFDKPRYFNLLLDAWEQKYKDNRLEGIKRLSSLAKFLE